MREVSEIIFLLNEGAVIIDVITILVPVLGVDVIVPSMSMVKCSYEEDGNRQKKNDKEES